VGESKTLNDKTVIYRNGRIRLDTIIVGKTNLDACDFHIVTGYGEPAEVKSREGEEQDDCQKTQPKLSNNRNQDTFQLWRGYTPVALE